MVLDLQDLGKLIESTLDIKKHDSEVFLYVSKLELNVRPGRGDKVWLLYHLLVEVLPDVQEYGGGGNICI